MSTSDQFLQSTALGTVVRIMIKFYSSHQTSRSQRKKQVVVLTGALWTQTVERNHIPSALGLALCAPKYPRTILLVFAFRIRSGGAC